MCHLRCVRGREAAYRDFLASGKRGLNPLDELNAKLHRIEDLESNPALHILIATIIIGAAFGTSVLVGYLSARDKMTSKRGGSQLLRCMVVQNQPGRDNESRRGRS